MARGFLHAGKSIMAHYIALLRGVNVGGNTLKMERLRELCADLDFCEVRTYVQSGNVVFEATGSAASVARALEKKLVGEARLPVSVITRTPSEFQKILRGNPFLKSKNASDEGKPVRHHVTFLSGLPAKSSLTGLQKLCSDGDQYHVAGREIYVFCPNGYGVSKFSNNAVEKALGIRATTRNWNTVVKLYQMATQEA